MFVKFNDIVTSVKNLYVCYPLLKSAKLDAPYIKMLFTLGTGSLQNLNYTTCDPRSIINF